ncbi:MAG TPA: sodium:proton antiporter, partial [Thioalkalivibrio sp.]|nr:sodium:proton antiporter [Thioalkalivibrio sp.]
MSALLRFSPLLLLLAAPAALAADAGLMDFTASTYGYLAVGIFVIAYLFVIAEDILHLRKSKPVLVAAGLIWLLVGLAYQGTDAQEAMHGALEHNLLEYVELLLFLLAAMTFINTLEERGVFDALRAWLVSRGFSLRSLFWIT